jgi:hypothetical protein
MARPKRLKLIGEEGFFHIMSSTVGQKFFLGDVEKEKLFNIIKYYSGYYIDLNPVRAGMVKRPEDYRWCGMGYRIYTDNNGDFLSFDGIFSESEMKGHPEE